MSDHLREILYVCQKVKVQGCCAPRRSDTRGTGTWRRLLGEFFKFSLRASLKLRLKCFNLVRSDLYVMSLGEIQQKFKQDGERR